MWRADDPQCNEASKVIYDIVPYTRGHGLDLGCGPYKAYPHFIGVDSGKQWGKECTNIDYSCEKLSIFAKQSLDFVFSSHLLEHIQDIRSALKEWWRVIKPGGHLVLYLPHADLYPKCGEPGANPDHKHDLLPETILDLMTEIGYWDLVVNEVRSTDYGAGEKGNEYSFFQVFKKRSDKKRAQVKKKAKTACVVRYGGFGDMIQASSIMPLLKAEGYHVSVMTTPHGKQILENDPHIDEFILQDRDQVPNEYLVGFWKIWEQKFDKFINLSESVEGTLLAMAGRPQHRWPKALRHKFLNVNYLEITHDIAELPYEFNARFYPTDLEIKWAKNERNKIGNKKTIVWSLNGSSVHKSWPYLDTVIARLMLIGNAHIYLMGDEASKILETGWEKEPRVHCMSGEWTIRQSLAFAQQADLVIGPETGVLNSVGMEDVAKIVTLSHSSEENLTKYWKNTTALIPNKTACYPCHMLHYGFTHCNRDEETGVSACQASITADNMCNAIAGVFKQWQHQIVRISA